MRVSSDPKQRIKRMSRRLKDLATRAQELERQHRTLAIQHHVLTCCCELLQWMRSSAAVHEGWLPHTAGLLPEELPLLEQLTSHPINQQLSNPEQQPRLLQLLNLQSSSSGAGGEELPGEQQQQQQQVKSQEPGSRQQSPPDEEQQQQDQQQQQQQQGLQQLQQRDVPQQQQAGTSSGCSCSAAQPTAVTVRRAAAAATAAVASNAAPVLATTIETTLSDTPAAAIAAPAAAAAAAAAVGSSDPAPPPPAVAATVGSSAAVDLHSLLFVAAPGDFLGPMRESFSRPPYPGAESITLQQWAAAYNDLVDVNAAMLEALERLQAGEQVQGPHPFAVMRDRLMQHVALVVSVMLLHPDDMLNKARLLNHDTMQLEENCSEQAWGLMWNAVDHLDFTEQQQDIISIGCDVFKRLITSVMQERQELAARQQSLLQLRNGRSLDLQQQQACAERLALVVRKERFLSQYLGTFVLSNCSVLQIAKLSQLIYPYSPQIAVLGAVLTEKRQEREEAERREQEQRRRRRRSTHGLNIP